MNVFSGNSNQHAIMQMYKAVNSQQEITVRDQKCKDLRNVAVVLKGGDCPITNFKDRNLNLDYAKREWLWYLGADRMDASIEQHAVMWKKLKQPDGSFYSNYGQYIFGEDPGKGQFSYVLKTLKQDAQSRRAVITLLREEHLFVENVDTVCTFGIRFDISNDCLNMTVLMRSNDVVFGFTNDAFCFWQVYVCLFALLKPTYPNLKLGEYSHFSASMHVYERHYKMLKSITDQSNGGFSPIYCPIPTAEEASQLIMTKGKEGSGPYAYWIKTFG